MDIKVSVENIDLGDYIDGHRDDEGDYIPGGTLADNIAHQLVEKFSRSDLYDGFRKRVQTLRDEEIRAQLTPVIAEAVAAPIKRTNTWGEKTGDDTTLREVIVDEARKWMDTKQEQRYGDRSTTTNLQAMIRAAVEDAFKTEIADAVKAARDAVTTEFGSGIGERVSGIVREALSKR